MDTFNNVFMDVLNDISSNGEDDLLFPTNETETVFTPIKGLKRRKPKILMDTKNMSHEDFSRARQEIQKSLGHTVLGGSDTGAVMGVSTYTSKQELYHEKTTGENKRDNAGKSWIFLGGHESEDLIAALTKEYWKIHGNHSVAILNDTGMYQCQTLNEDGTLRYPFAVGNLDRVINLDGKTGVMECKTVMNFEKIQALKKGIIPPDYECQCRYYMAIMDYNFAIISFYWGPSENEFKSFIIRRDFELEQNLMEEMRDFWLHIESKQEPDFSKVYNPSLVSNWYKRYYASIDTTLPEIDMTGQEDEIETVLSLNEQIKDLKKQIKDLEDMKTDIFSNWLQQYGYAGIGYAELSDGQIVSVERIISYQKQNIDLEKLKNDLPDLYETYANKFNEDAFKTDYPDIYQEYLEAPKVNLKSKTDPFKLNARKLKKGVI